VLVTRDRYLKTGGLMLPSKASIVVAGVYDPALWQRRVAFWDDVYGFSMRTMKRWVTSAKGRRCYGDEGAEDGRRWRAVADPGYLRAVTAV